MPAHEKGRPRFRATEEAPPPGSIRPRSENEEEHVHELKLGLTILLRYIGGISFDGDSDLDHCRVSETLLFKGCSFEPVIKVKGQFFSLLTIHIQSFSKSIVDCMERACNARKPPFKTKLLYCFVQMWPQ